MTRRFTGDRLIVATHNRGKLEEIADLLSPYGLSLSSNADHGLPEPVEDGVKFVENARIKARAAVAATGLPALADDSGIEIDALGNRPGVWTADWAETPKGRDFGLAMTRAHDELVAAGAAQPWRARFCCTLVLAWPDGHDEVYPGTMEGQIVWPMRGAQGHGYDPIFQPDGYTVTFGEMDRWEKNRISHRADAFAKMIAGSFA
ncbi:Non-canonical purine NTP pyrophosphatase [Rhodobacteraceae bacterium THAF1]|uniref:non-canonical purine NTP pyrophosphatase n=1 Tax=Palleronia sp. THAF1 TaxID=2587842 RepID=UPI000F3D2780|nr:non-canonical purine NTP pyrophosphatase [Palleronia sp. THAF1]QFU10164.1 Non-canonical purine NTP pyrophosphatase [Palleronia sp. THAF1]VDC16931.1 Non-canonical purine NTP pyrophosphatase [Rhodobacteraceae bacterium THAF1]